MIDENGWNNDEDYELVIGAHVNMIMNKLCIVGKSFFAVLTMFLLSEEEQDACTYQFIISSTDKWKNKL